MIGAIAGDIIGSVYESYCLKTTDFLLFRGDSTFTDDTVLTVAVADCILHSKDYATTFKYYARKYPHAGFGGMFFRWAKSNSLKPYNSFGNGSAMRVSPVGFAFDSMEQVLAEAKRSAEVTHSHPEGIKGAQAIAAAVFLARKQESKSRIKEFIERNFSYDLNKTLAEIRPYYRFDETCQGSVPQAIMAFLESDSYEDAVRKAVSLGGDSDTLACMAGGIAEAYYKTIPDYIVKEVRNRLDPELLKVVEQFSTITEIEALRDRIEKLEQLVGKLTLENDLLKRGK
jgi:ADP-ribosylglycohydrolase